jgi:hypothetical protein
MGKKTIFGKMFIHFAEFPESYWRFICLNDSESRW